MKRLLGIAGFIGAGKSTMAKLLRDEEGFEVLSFATPVKEMAATLLMVGFGYTRANVDYYLENKGEVIPDLGVTMRHVLQTLGTDWGRNMINPDIWVDSGLRRMRPYLGGRYVFDDVRFENEADLIRRVGGLVVHVETPRDSRYKHSSEDGICAELDDEIIDNFGGEEAFIASVHSLIDTHVRDTDELIRLCHTPCYRYVV